MADQGGHVGFVPTRDMNKLTGDSDNRSEAALVGDSRLFRSSLEN
jgi:hypothetical protein